MCTISVANRDEYITIDWWRQRSSKKGVEWQTWLQEDAIDWIGTTRQLSRRSALQMTELEDLRHRPHADIIAHARPLPDTFHSEKRRCPSQKNVRAINRHWTDCRSLTVMGRVSRRREGKGCSRYDDEEIWRWRESTAWTPQLTPSLVAHF